MVMSVIEPADAENAKKNKKTLKIALQGPEQLGRFHLCFSLSNCFEA